MIPLIDQDAILLIHEIVQLIQRIIFVTERADLQFIPDQFLKIVLPFLQKRFNGIAEDPGGGISAEIGINAKGSNKQKDPSQDEVNISEQEIFKKGNQSVVFCFLTVFQIASRSASERSVICFPVKPTTSSIFMNLDMNFRFVRSRTVSASMCKKRA